MLVVQASEEDEEDDVGVEYSPEASDDEAEQRPATAPLVSRGYSSLPARERDISEYLAYDEYPRVSYYERLIENLERKRLLFEIERVYNKIWIF